MTRKRLFLGSIAVAPRADLKRLMERPLEGAIIDLTLQAHLEESLQLPQTPPAGEIGKHDYCIDIVVAKHQIGEAWNVEAGELDFPLLWRPAVEVWSRIYALRSGKPVATFRVKRRMPWSDYLGRSFSIKGYLGWSSPLCPEDMTRLLDEALIEILERARARL